jgi:alkanesulfonate monooxygenase SsuD/methylene tetrahydromethanopterin reductase-like flavin-dependent oxidoreductase (luciferase family)
MQAANTSVYAGSWRHPATEHAFLTASYYEKLGRTLEDGCFDLMFFDDRLAMPGIYAGSVAEAVRLGARPVKLDLSIVLGVAAGATRSIGLGATYSTTYYSPFHFARTFATLDHLSGGRAAWNVVTSVNDGEAQNFGVEHHLDHDARYDRADEFLEATTGLWDSWDDDALVLDRATGVFADPAKVHELNHDGEWFRVRGPLTVPRSPQGRPVLLQAGSSGRGRDFAARWAELIFTGDPNIDVARSHYKDQKERIAERGRDPAQVKMLPMAYTVIGESRAHAEEREQLFLNERGEAGPRTADRAGGAHRGRRGARRARRPGLRPAEARAAQRDPRPLAVGTDRVRVPGAGHGQRGNHRPLRHPGAEGALPAAAARRRDVLLLLDDRAPCGRRPHDVQDPCRQGRRRVGRQRLEVLLVERQDRELPDRHGGDEPRREPVPGHVDVPGADRHPPASTSCATSACGASR